MAEALTINEITLRFAAAGMFVGAGPSLDPLELKLIGSREQFTALLPTDEERWAIKALRSEYWAEWDDATQSCKIVSLSPTASQKLWEASKHQMPTGHTPIAALAAAGRVLEEGEKHNG